MTVGRLRRIQSLYETGDLRNPDSLVFHFLSLVERYRCWWLGKTALASLRSQPFYYYLVARTKYYDGVFVDAIAGGARQIINIGCGSDTRSHRFEHLLRQASVRVLELDQSDVIRAKQRLARQRRLYDGVEYGTLDLNDGAWPDFEQRLRETPAERTLVLMEGVSPYIEEAAFCHFLSLMSNSLAVGSQIAYDYKLRGVDDDFGRVGRTLHPFRLSGDRADVNAFHGEFGFRLDHFELGAELTRRLLPGIGPSSDLFHQDGLVRVRIPGRDSTRGPTT